MNTISFCLNRTLTVIYCNIELSVLLDICYMFQHSVIVGYFHIFQPMSKVCFINYNLHIKLIFTTWTWTTFIRKNRCLWIGTYPATKGSNLSIKWQKKKRGIQPINQKKKGSNPNQHGVDHQKLSLLSSVYIVMISTFHSPSSEEYDQKKLDMSHPL